MFTDRKKMIEIFDIAFQDCQEKGNKFRSGALRSCGCNLAISFHGNLHTARNQTSVRWAMEDFKQDLLERISGLKKWLAADIRDCALEEATDKLIDEMWKKIEELEKIQDVSPIKRGDLAKVLVPKYLENGEWLKYDSHPWKMEWADELVRAVYAYSQENGRTFNPKSFEYHSKAGKTLFNSACVTGATHKSRKLINDYRSRSIDKAQRDRAEEVLKKEHIFLEDIIYVVDVKMRQEFNRSPKEYFNWTRENVEGLIREVHGDCVQKKIPFCVTSFGRYNRQASNLYTTCGNEYIKIKLLDIFQAVYDEEKSGRKKQRLNKIKNIIDTGEFKFKDILFVLTPDLQLMKNI